MTWDLGHNCHYKIVISPSFYEEKRWSRLHFILIYAERFVQSTTSPIHSHNEPFLSIAKFCEILVSLRSKLAD
mgnify:CR=1 FL=1